MAPKLADVLKTGDDVAGCVYSGLVSGSKTYVNVRCGGHGGTCGSMFSVTLNELLLADRRGFDLRCLSCRAEESPRKNPDYPHTKRCPNGATGTVLKACIKLAGPLMTMPFTYVEIVIEAWLTDKQKFGLRGYELFYPDSNRVKVELCKVKDGRVLNHYIERIGPNLYRFHQAGIDRVHREKRDADQKVTTG